MALPAGLALSGKLFSLGGTGLLVDDLTGKNLQRILSGTPRAQRAYTVDADGNFQRQVPEKIESKPQKRNALEQFLYGIPEAERKYTIDENYEYKAVNPSTSPTNITTSETVVTPTSQVSPQDRAYAKERARVEAMVQSNPDMQKQDIAAARAKVRDQGLAEWAKANPELAKNVRPGQVGYEIARDVAYPMPSSLADPSIPDLGYNINLQYDPGLGRTISNTDVKPSVVDTSTQLPPSAEQTYMDPDFYQLQGYQQGQGAAASQTEGPKVAKLGSAIRRELYPQFDGTTSFSPQMREIFPDRSTQSLENVVQEKGVQLPDSMINADGQNELLSGLTDNRMYQYNQQVAEVNKLLNLIADRQLGR